MLGIWASVAPAGTRTAQIGIGALLSALAPYVATSTRFLVHDAAADRAATSSCSSLVGELLGWRAALLHAPPQAGVRVLRSTSSPAPLIGDGEVLGSRAAALLLQASGAPRGYHLALDGAAAVTGTHAGPRLPSLHDADALPVDATATSTGAALVDLPVAPRLALPHDAPRRLNADFNLIDASHAPHGLAASPLPLVATPDASIAMSLAPLFGAWPRRGTTVSIHPAALLSARSFSTATPKLNGSRNPAVSIHSTVMSLYPAGSLFTRSAGSLLTRSFATSNPKHAARVRATRMRRQVGPVDSLDLLLRDMGYFTRGPFARYFGLFTVFTVMSEGVRECKKRFGEVSIILRRLGDVETMRWVRENGEVREEILGENFSWLFD